MQKFFTNLQVLVGVGAPAVGEPLPPLLEHLTKDPLFKDIPSREVVAVGMNLSVDGAAEGVFFHEEHLVRKAPL